MLTREEKLAKLDQIRANYRADRASAEQRATIEREKARIESERRNTDLRRASEDREMKMVSKNMFPYVYVILHFLHMC